MLFLMEKIINQLLFCSCSRQFTFFQGCGSCQPKETSLIIVGASKRVPRGQKILGLQTTRPSRQTSRPEGPTKLVHDRKIIFTSKGSRINHKIAFALKNIYFFFELFIIQTIYKVIKIDFCLGVINHKIPKAKYYKNVDGKYQVRHATIGSKLQC